MTGKLLLASATTAAALVSAAPAMTHGSPAARQDTVSTRGGSVVLVAPGTARVLTATVSGSRALAASARMLVVRTGDGATLFTGSLATFRGLRVAPGTEVRVEVERAPRAGSEASAVLQWS